MMVFTLAKAFESETDQLAAPLSSRGFFHSAYVDRLACPVSTALSQAVSPS